MNIRICLGVRRGMQRNVDDFKRQNYRKSTFHDGLMMGLKRANFRSNPAMLWWCSKLSIFPWATAACFLLPMFTCSMGGATSPAQRRWMERVKSDFFAFESTMFGFNPDRLLLTIRMYQCEIHTYEASIHIFIGFYWVNHGKSTFFMGKKCQNARLIRAHLTPQVDMPVAAGASQTRLHVRR